MFDDDDEELKRKIIFEKVAKAIKENPKNWSSKLEEFGFEWFDDEYDEEEEEEKVSKPENHNQEFLVVYFEGSINLSDQVLDSFLAEKESDSPNYPLFRKYFKRGNEKPKKMLVFGLEKNPTDIGLLNDLAYFHEFKSIPGELIQLYLIACENETDLGNFEELVWDFYINTEPNGYYALHELEQQYPSDSGKGKIVRKIKERQESQLQTIQF